MNILKVFVLICVMMVSSVRGQVCGNGLCETAETVSTCPADCQAVLCNGNGICNAGEDSVSCPSDCSVSICNTNGICEPGETSSNCQQDCASITCNRNSICETGETADNCPSDCIGVSFCGNLKCEAGESSATCPVDCQPGGGMCGNGLCESGETSTNCPQDCLSSTTASTSSGFCGDGLCQTGETPSSCPSDCSSCGNGLCDSGETSTNCPSDCPPGTVTCGNGVCESTESTATCPTDCPNRCGNGICESGETQSSCPQDCTPSTTAISTTSSTSSTTSSSTTGIVTTTTTTGGSTTSTTFPATTGTTGTTGTSGEATTTGGTTGCQPNCQGKVCGTDGCGGSCGSCSSGLFCSNQGTLCIGGAQVTGFVYDSVTKAKLPDTNCTLTNSSPDHYAAKTDGNGQYRFTDVKPDIYVLKCINARYLDASIQVLVEVSTTEQRLPSLYLVSNPCLHSPACSGHGHCASDGETCICDDGAGGYDCSGSLLAAVCVPYKGIFSEGQVNSVLIRSAIQKALVRLENLYNDLISVRETLPEYMSNSCCYDSHNHTSTATNPNYYEFTHYPLDLESMASISYSFLGELDEYNSDNVGFLHDLQL